MNSPTTLPATTTTTTTTTTTRSLSRRWGLPLTLTALVLAAHYVYDRRTMASSRYFNSVLRRLDVVNPDYTIPYDTTTSKDGDLPKWTKHLDYVWNPVKRKGNKDRSTTATVTPLLWSIPNAGDEALLTIFSSCLGLTLAANHELDTDNKTLAVLESTTQGQEVGDDKKREKKYIFTPKFVNVLTHSKEWLDKCHGRGLVQSGMSDVMSTEHIQYAAETVFAEQTARGFVMMRHPVKRAIAVIQQERQQGSGNGNGNSNLVDLLKQQHVRDSIDNYEVRSLLGMLDDPDEKVTADHVETAKQILRQHFVVGIYEWFDVSVVRFEKYFGWWQQHQVLTNKTINNCHYQVIDEFQTNNDDKHNNNNNKNEKSTSPDQANAYSILLNKHWADVELYHAAKTLFVEQSKLL